MNWRALVAALALAACAQSEPPSPPPLVGAWRLVEYVDTPEGGAPVRAFGEQPGGMFVFSADGHASISIMRNPPQPDAAITDPDPDACVPEWYCSYFGTYTIDAANSAWTVRVEGGNIPSFIGTDQTRSFTIEGDRLTLSGEYDEGGRNVRFERVLVRATATRAP